ncbi:NAD-P-binding protein, partial [Peniophora sp. CONT]
MSSAKFTIESLAGIKGFDERLNGLTDRHDVYPAIDPQAAFSSKSFTGKVVLITGASRGLGQVMATFYARAGAKLALVARSASNLDALKKQIQKESDVEILTFVLDVKDTQAAAKAVQDTVDHFGKIDIVIPNAGISTGPTFLGDRDIAHWWNTLEVNLLGTLNFVGPALKHLEKTNGYVIAISSRAAQARIPGASDYGISKLALSRLVEFIALEYKTVSVFSVHPGAVWTDMGKDSGAPKELFAETPELAAATVLALASGKYDWLSGRFVDATQDLGELEQLKEQILGKDALVSKLALV